MDILGKLRELVQLVFSADGYDVELKPNTSTTYTANRDFELPVGDASDELTGNAATQTLSNKTLTTPKITDAGAGDLVVTSSDGALASDRTLNIDVNDADRTVDLSGNLTVEAASTINQDVTSDASPTFAGATLSGLTASLPVFTDGSKAATSNSITGSGSVVMGSAPTITSPVLNTGVSGTAVLDEDNMASDSATQIATQQSIKAYVDTHAADTSTHGVGVVVGTSEAAILTSKTIDADLNTITNIENADIKAGAAIDREKLASGTADHVVINNGSGVASSEAQLAKTRGGTGVSSTATFPTSGTVVTRTATEDLSGKTFTDHITMTEIAAPSTPASGDMALYPKTDGKLYFKNDGGVETEIGAGGSGSGEINYITNSDAEDNNTTGWDTYADAAGSTPVDGTGGSATTTWTAQSGTALRGTYSFKLTKDAANRQGEGVASGITLDPADESKKLKISFDWKTSANYVAGDVGVYIYDITNTTLITPSEADLPARTTDGGTHTISFDATTSNSYRLIFHVATTNASAYDVYVDNVIVGPGAIVTGAAVGPWIAYTPSNTQGFGTISSNNLEWRRNGDSMEIRGEFTCGTTTASEGQLELPDSLTIGGQSTNTVIVGPAWRDATSQTHGMWIATKNDTYLNLGAWSGSTGFNPLTPSVVNALFGSSTRVSVNTTAIPIAEWAGSGTLNVGTNRVEYAFNTDETATTSVTASGFGYGPAGTGFSANFATGTAWIRRVQFQTDIQSTDIIEIQHSNDDGVTWGRMGERDEDICSFIRLAGSRYGMYIESEGTNYVDVAFGAGGRIASSGTFGNAGAAFSGLASTHRWRVVKHSAGVPVGFGLADEQGNSGLVAPYSEGTGVLYSGTYTPTITHGSLTNASTVGRHFYTRLGNLVTVHGTLTGVTTSGGGTADFRVTLPIAENIATADQLVGQGKTSLINTNMWESVYIQGDTTNDEADVQMRTSTTTSRTIHYSFTYELL